MKKDRPLHRRKTTSHATIGGMPMVDRMVMTVAIPSGLRGRLVWRHL
jgi:hypothetical protein